MERKLSTSIRSGLPLSAELFTEHFKGRPLRIEVLSFLSNQSDLKLVELNYRQEAGKQEVDLVMEGIQVPEKALANELARYLEGKTGNKVKIRITFIPVILSDS